MMCEVVGRSVVGVRSDAGEGKVSSARNRGPRRALPSANSSTIGGTYEQSRLAGECPSQCRKSPGGSSLRARAEGQPQRAPSPGFLAVAEKRLTVAERESMICPKRSTARSWRNRSNEEVGEQRGDSARRAFDRLKGASLAELASVFPDFLGTGPWLRVVPKGLQLVIPRVG